MKITIKEGIASVDFGRPQVANSLDLAAWEDLGNAFRSLSDKDEVRVIILQGEGKHWCAGMDVTVLHTMGAQVQPIDDGSAVKLKSFIQGIQQQISAIAVCPKPVIAAIHGGCIGGGVAIASACDLLYATEDAYFTIKEIDFGIVADIGTLQRLPQKMPVGLVAELSYTGRPMHAPEAKVAGFINATFPTKSAVLAHAMTIAEVIVTKDADAIEGIKHQLAYAQDHSVAEGLDAVADYSAKLMLRKLRGLV